MSRTDAKKWDAKYAGPGRPDPDPIPFLKDHIGNLGSGQALVLASGRGRNALYLAEMGFDVTALDVSVVGLEQCRVAAASRGLEIRILCEDLDTYELGSDRYDLITMFYYHQPSLFPSIRKAIMPGGYFLFCTFGTRHAEIGTLGTLNPKFLASRKDVEDAFSRDAIRILEEPVIENNDGVEALLQAIVQINTS